MKVIKWSFLAISIVLFLGACGNRDYGVINASTNDVQKIIDDKQNGFVIIKNEEDAQFLREVNKALIEKRQTALQFDVFHNNSKNENEDGLSNNPFSFEMPHVNALYYVENGEVIGEFNLELYEGIRQQEELSNFIDTLTTRKKGSIFLLTSFNERV